MYRTLDPSLLGGVAVRQSELIELALSYNFSGIAIDLSDFESQLKHGSLEHTGRLIASAQLKVGAFELPIDFNGSDEEFAVEKAKLMLLAKAASDLGAQVCRATIPPATDERPYHEQFEFCRKRMTDIGAVLAEHDVKLALAFQAPAVLREKFAFQFIHTFDELTKLVESIRQPNVGICIDTWQWFHGGGDLSQLESIGPERVLAVDLSDCTVAASDTAEESTRRLPGTVGNIDTIEILKWLGSIDFAGPLMPAADASSFAGQKRDDVLQQTKDALIRQLVAAGLSDEPLPPEPLPPEPVVTEAATDSEEATDSSDDAAETEPPVEVGAAEK